MMWVYSEDIMKDTNKAAIELMASSNAAAQKASDILKDMLTARLSPRSRS